MHFKSLLTLSLGLTACGDFQPQNQANTQPAEVRKTSKDATCKNNSETSLNLKVVGCNKDRPVYQSISVKQTILKKKERSAVR